jgi:hypothetical protein
MLKEPRKAVDCQSLPVLNSEKPPSRGPGHASRTPQFISVKKDWAGPNFGIVDSLCGHINGPHLIC